MEPLNRHDLSDDQWDRLAPLLPARRADGCGRPAKDHPTIINGILWRLRTGAPWRDLPSCYGNWQTVYSRFRRWQRAGVWEHILTALQEEAVHDDRIDGSLTMIDGSNVRAHQHAAGARKKGDQLRTRDWGAAAADSAASCI